MSDTELKEKTNSELFKLYHATKDRAAKQELTLRYVYIVKAVAYQMHDMYSGFMQAEDIINEGVIEIMKAIDRYDPSKDNQFETFISRRIRGLVIDMIRRNDWLPRNFHRDSRTIEQTQQKLQQKLGRAPTDKELSEKMGTSIEKLQKIRRMSTMMNVLSLDMTYDDSDDALLQIPSEDISQQPEKSFMKKETSRILTEAVNSLQEKERTVISLYYVEELNMNQIAEVMEVSQPRISQLHTSAIKKLKKYMLEHQE